MLDNKQVEQMQLSSSSILLVEDDRVDAMTVKRAFKELKISNPLIVRENGESALTYLKATDHDRPCLVLLDLNMPIMNGTEFLHAIKADATLRRIPVIVLTTSDEQQDKVESFDLGVAGYMKKPVEYRSFVEVVRTIDMYWTLCEAPPV